MNQLQPLLNHLWQSTLFAAAAGLLTLALRKNRAQARYCLWMAASVKFLVPFSILVDLGSRWGRHTASAIEASSFSFAMMEPAGRPPAASVPLLTTLPAAAAAPSPVHWIPAILAAVWAAGCAILVGCWWWRWRNLRAVLRTASRLDLEAGMEVRTSPAFAEPGVFGIFRPVLLLPAGITGHLTGEQFEAIVRHEQCHVRRRDNLATVIHMAVETLFWFHPLVWWLGARLLDERERACDEEVLRRGSQPLVYAEGILKICELYLSQPLPCVSGVTGANLKKRIEVIMSNPAELRLSIAKKTILAAAATAALAAPIVVGILNAPAIRAQSLSAQSGTARKFEVASIRPCKAEDAQGGGRGKKGGGGGGRVTWSPGRLDEPCQTVRNLIRDAYLAYPEGKPWRAGTREDPNAPSTGSACTGCGMGVPPISNRQLNEPFKGSPGWVESDRYTIEAKTDGPATPEMMRGPMMQALLEERFHLKVHRETRDVPVYELSVAREGHKLQPAKEGNCQTRDQFRVPPEPGSTVRPCGGFWSGKNAGTDSNGTTLANFCRQLSVVFDRDVIDKTGLTGLFDIHLDTHPTEPPPEIAATHDESGPPSAAERDWFATSTLLQFREALPKIGLKLETAKAPAVFLVIDRVERPTEN